MTHENDERTHEVAWDGESWQETDPGYERDRILNEMQREADAALNRLGQARFGVEQAMKDIGYRIGMQQGFEQGFAAGAKREEVQKQLRHRMRIDLDDLEEKLLALGTLVSESGPMKREKFVRDLRELLQDYLPNED